MFGQKCWPLAVLLVIKNRAVISAQAQQWSGASDPPPWHPATISINTGAQGLIIL